MRFTFLSTILLACTPIWAQATVPSAAHPFFIRVIDQDTNRPVPLVQLMTPDHVRYFTDSNGIAAIDDPVFNNRDVYFFISSPGYAYPKDFLGNSGERVKVQPGTSVTIKIKRLNIAERLYRLTGEGIYRDSVMAGLPVPISHPLINAEVVGQDTAGAQAIVYHNLIYWLFGDTSRLSYALGQFGMSGATSKLPSDGGLDPSIGVDLNYFVGDDGFSRPMMPHFDVGPAWFDGLTILKDADGHEQMVGACANVKDLGNILGRYLMKYDDATERFQIVKRIPLTSLRPHGQGRHVTLNGIDFIYFSGPFPNIRVRANIDDFFDPTKYESFTCLKPGEKFLSDAPINAAAAQIDRDSSGKIIWAWKRDTTQIDDDSLAALIKAKKLRPDEAWYWPLDVEAKKYVLLHSGDVTFNNFRHKWIMLAQNDGDVYYLEADDLNGPWKWARKVATHGRNNFYNLAQLTFFEQENGRLIYFDGTYSFTFTATEPEATPRYDYNQLMYRLDLADPRLELPQ
jgi:hypothetical protein